MKCKTLLAVALCLMMIAIVGGAASGVAGTLSSLPGYEDALAVANGTTSGTSPSGTLGSMPGYQDALNNSGVLQGTSLSGTLRSLPGYQEALNQWTGMPGASSDSISAISLVNEGWFVAQLACYYSTDGGVTWHESEHIKGIAQGEVGFSELGDLGVPYGALVKIHAVVVGGKDRTGSKVFEYVYNEYYADYVISGVTWNPWLSYYGIYRWKEY